MTYEQFSDILDHLDIEKLYEFLENYSPCSAIPMDLKNRVEAEIQNSIEYYGKENFYKYFFHDDDKWIWIDGDDAEAVAVSIKDDEALKEYILGAILDDPDVCEEIVINEFDSELKD